MYVKPVDTEELICDFDLGDHLPIEGREVTRYLEYWEGLIIDGKVKIDNPPVAT